MDVMCINKDPLWYLSGRIFIALQATSFKLQAPQAHQSFFIVPYGMPRASHY
jgi:hypothetical protein